MTASEPFMSAAPSPCTWPSSSRPGRLPCSGTVSECPARTTSGRPGGPNTIASSWRCTTRRCGRPATRSPIQAVTRCSCRLTEGMFTRSSARRPRSSMGHQCDTQRVTSSPGPAPAAADQAPPPVTDAPPPPPPRPPPERPVRRLALEPVSVRTLFLAGVALMAVVAAAVLAWQLLHVVLLVLTAVVLGEGLRAEVDWVHERGVPYGLSVAAVYVVLIAVTLGILVLLTRPIAGQAGSVVAGLPGYETTVRTNVSELLVDIHIDSGVLNQLVAGVLGQASQVTLTVLQVGSGLLSLLSDIGTVLLL
ncbi:MAG: AI-2E family transporter, partial [Chloroflexi bacterium]